LTGRPFESPPRSNFRRLANAKVVDTIKARIRDDEDEPEAGQTQFLWGMLSDLRVLSRGEHGEFLLETDEANFDLKYVKRNGQPYFNDVQIK
jgi:hypothetical protein